MSELHPWVRRDDEGARPFQAFRTYMNLGTSRSIRKAAEIEGKSTTQLEDWSAKHEWVERARAYDQYVATAEVDGYADQLASVRSRHMAIADKLLSRLDENLDLLKPGQDPSMRWTQAFTAAAKVHRDALEMRADKNETGNGVLERIVALMAKLESGD